MPELPDVEVAKKYLDATSLHQEVDHIQLNSNRILRDESPQQLGLLLKGKPFIASCRHGKYLFIQYDRAGWLALHFGMTGRLAYFRHEKGTPNYSQLLFHFSNGFDLAYVSRRKLGYVTTTREPRDFIDEHGLGVDALELTEKDFCEMANRRAGGVKAWLMDQKSMAGIGNIYSDEILFQAGIHPLSAVRDLDGDTLKQLYRALGEVLGCAIEAQADPPRLPSDYLLPNRKKGADCPICDAPLATTKAAGRTSWYCPRHQKR